MLGMCKEPIDTSKPIKTILVEGVEDRREIVDKNKE